MLDFKGNRKANQKNAFPESGEGLRIRPPKRVPRIRRGPERKNMHAGSQLIPDLERQLSLDLSCWDHPDL